MDLQISERRELMHHLPRCGDLENRVSESDGYAWLPPDAFSALPAALTFAQQVFEQRRSQVKLDQRIYRGADLLTGTRYEDAPPLFDLALSNEILQLASDYMGEIPVLLKPRLWWTRPEGPNAQFSGTQLFHRGRPEAPHIRRQAKFLVTVNDVDENSGPFTFISADLSAKIFPGYCSGERVSDEEMYRNVPAAATLRHVGPPGTILMVDTCRCFHFGRRASSKERLLLMIQFMGHADAPEQDRVERSATFVEKYAGDPVRMLVMPD